MTQIKLKSVGTLLCAAFLLALLVPPRLAAQNLERVSLEPFAVSRGQWISVSDLLPPQTPLSLRSAAREIVLGVAPLPGAHRTLARAQIVEALNSAPPLLRSLEIPVSVDISRWSRKLTPEEVLAAITRSLSANHLSAPEALTVRDIAFAPVIVTENAPRLEVTRIEELPGVTRARLWSPSEPRLAPFFVNIDRSLSAADTAQPASAVLPIENRLAGSPAAIPDPAAPPSPEARVRESEPSIHPVTPIPMRQLRAENPVLVKVGQHLQLIVHAGGMSLMAPVVCLSAGRLGEKVRVHLLPNGKTLLATIVDAQTARIDF